MKVIIPTNVDDTVLLASTVSEDDAPEWNSSLSYSVGDLVIIVATHQRYEALTANSNTPPAENPADWLLLGMTNRWQMFDQKVGTVTSATETITVDLTPGLVTALALLEVEAVTIDVTMTDTTEGLVYQQSFGLYDPTGIIDWWHYFFEDIRAKRDLVITGLPSYRNATLTVTATSSVGAPVSIGSLVLGKLRVFWEAVDYGASVGIQDYSRKERDAFGNYEVVERRFSKTANWKFLIHDSDVDIFQRQLSELRATAAVYIGSKHESNIIYGFYRDFDVVISYPTFSECSIELEGLT